MAGVFDIFGDDAFTGTAPLQPIAARTAPGGFGAGRGGGKKAGGKHTVQAVAPPTMSQRDIAGLATQLSTIQKFRGGQEDFNTVLKMLDGVYSGYGRNSKSRLTDYPRVYLTPDVAQALQQLSTGGEQYVGQNYDDVKITVARDGSMLVPGSADQRRALQVGDLVGTVTMGNPLTGKHGVVVGSPTYWKIYGQLRGGDRTNWHNRLFDFGMGPAATAAGLRRGTPIPVGNLSKDQKKVLKAGYEALKNPEKVRLGYLAQIAQLLNTVHYLENSESSALPTSQWGTAAGKRHAALMSQEILAGVNKFLRSREGSDAYKFASAIRYVPTSAAKAVRYSDAVKGQTKDGRNKATQRSLWNPWNVGYTDEGDQILIAKGGKSLAMSKSKSQPRHVHAAAFSGPGITNKGQFRNVQARTKLANGGVSHHMRPGKQYDILDSYINNTSAAGRTPVRGRRTKAGEQVYVPSTRARSTAGIPVEMQRELAARGFSADRGGFYAMASGQGQVMDPYGMTWEQSAEQERARDIALGNVGRKPTKADWDQYQGAYQAYLAGRGPKPVHPRGRAPAAQRNAQNNF